jgi:branched-chain amino acid transport system permease protein
MRERLRYFDTIGAALWLFRAIIIVLVIYGSFRSLQAGRYTSVHWLNFIIFGLAQGSVYALIALGYTLVYGVLFMINFAHGDFMMAGVFTATVFIAIPMGQSGFIDRSPILALLIITLVAAAVSTSVSVLTERIAYRPLRRAPRLVPLITAIGASFFWQYFMRGLYGSGVTVFPEVQILKGDWTLGSIEILKTQGVVIIASILLMIGLYIFVQKTKTGKAMRAVAEDKDVAALMGIDVDRVIVITFAVGAALAGAAGVLYALLFRQVSFIMGFIPGIKAFTAAVLGGIGSVPGAMLGGLFLGIFESVGPSLFLEGLGIPAPYQLKDVIAFTMLVLVLIFRPTGILGERLAEEKA